MTEEQIALSRRAVACKGWRWMPGMLLADGAWRARVGENWPWYAGAEVLPVLADPATLGCLLALVREVCEDEGVGAICQFVGILNGGRMWSLIGDGGEFGGYHTTEAEALVAALESAP
jgi:hypothetical protein